MFDSTRSFLFVPGDSEKKIGKALDGAADALILDLEDAVSPENRPSARQICAEVLAGERGKPLIVRVNGIGSDDILQDLAVVVRARPDGIMLPKCTGLRDVEQLAHYLTILEAREGLEQGAIRILPIVTETAAAVLATPSFQGGHGRLAHMLWGGEDLAASLGAFSNRCGDNSYAAPYIAARTSCLLAAAAGQVGAIDAVYTDFRNDAGLRAEAEDALRDGFTAKAAIHPAQVDVINDVFTPTAEVVAEAEAVISALAGGKSVAVLNGRLVEAPHLKKAWKILARVQR